jgi:5'-nucleotidase
MLTIAVSSRTLFQIEDGDKIFREQGQEAFDSYMREKEHVPLRPGVAFGLVKKLLALNTNAPGTPRDRVEVVVLSRNSAEAGLRIIESVIHYGLDIEKTIFCSGGDRFTYARGLGAHLFLSANSDDVKAALDHGVAAATMMPKESAEESETSDIRIAFDGDSVLFSSESDEVYRAHGLEVFRKEEQAKANIPLGAGPFKPFLDALLKLQKQFPKGKCPVKLALVTARGAKAAARVIRTLRSWGVFIDDAVFADGMPKGPLVKAFSADIFFDDTVKNVTSVSDHDITSCHVPYGEGHGIVAPAPAAPSAEPLAA